MAAFTRLEGQEQTNNYDEGVRMMNQNQNHGQPPAYGSNYNYNREPHPKWYNVRHWSKKVIAAVIFAVVVILVIVIVVPVVVTKKNAYPNYSKLNYSLADTISGTNFFDQFNYFTGYDPAQGFVHYLTSEQSAQFNLTYATPTSATLRVENNLTAQTTGRFSVRITSKKTYDTGLFVFDIQHSPYGCASWPALWLTDPNPAIWPGNGEIDIMEAVNGATTGNQMTLHTTNDCSMSVKRQETATVLTDNCYNGTNSNSGCGVSGPPSTYGSAFNAAGGGIMAVELRSAGIRMWQFARNAIPADITAATSPDPSTWGTALADFPSTNCDIGSHFRNQSIIANIDVCGPWAGAPAIFNTQDNCPGTCTDYAANTPSGFDNAYWTFGAFRVYQAS